MNQMIRAVGLKRTYTGNSEIIKAMASAAPFSFQPKLSLKPVRPPAPSSSSGSASVFPKLTCQFWGSVRSIGQCRGTRKLGPGNGSKFTCLFRFGKSGADAGIYGSQARDDFDRDDVEQYFNYMGMLAVEGSYDKMEALLNQNIHPIDILLLMAASEGDMPKIEEVLRAGADYTVKDADGRSALDRAASDEIKDFILNFKAQEA